MLHTKKSFIITISIILVILLLLFLIGFSKNRELDTSDEQPIIQDEQNNCSEKSDQMQADICYSYLATSSMDVDECNNIINDSMKLSCIEQINRIVQTMNSVIPGTR